MNRSWLHLGAVCLGLAAFAAPAAAKSPSSAQAPSPRLVALLARSDSLFAQRQWQEAAATCQDIVRLAPDHLASWQRLGGCEYTLHDYMPAARCGPFAPPSPSGSGN